MSSTWEHQGTPQSNFHDLTRKRELRADVVAKADRPKGVIILQNEIPKKKNTFFLKKKKKKKLCTKIHTN